MKERGIRHELSVVHCPQQNGVAERFNRILVESARTIIAHAGVASGVLKGRRARHLPTPPFLGAPLEVLRT